MLLRRCSLFICTNIAAAPAGPGGSPSGMTPPAIRWPGGWGMCAAGGGGLGGGNIKGGPPLFTDIMGPPLIVDNKTTTKNLAIKKS